MRCYSCDCSLSDFECSIKGKLSGEHLNMCVKCLRSAEIDYHGNNALKYKREQDEESFKPVNLDKPLFVFTEEDADE